jgi:predicted  nucleic acid-binding Zn-ribbon protein
MSICITCEEEYSDKRKALGYSTCLNCGESEARVISQNRASAKLREMTPYLSGSLAQPDALFDSRPGCNTGYAPGKPAKSIKS